MSVPEASIKSFVVALTGGIASGKTVVSDAFAKLGANIVDTDIIAREIVSAGTAGLKAVVDTFGTQILDQEGNLDRQQMRAIIFTDLTQRKRLENLVHPLIRTEAINQLQASDAQIAILVVPLLIESGEAYGWVDRVLVVDAPESTQIKRLMRRDGISKIQAEAILYSQATREQRLLVADDVLNNDGDLKKLKQETESLYENYLQQVGDKSF